MDPIEDEPLNHPPPEEEARLEAAPSLFFAIPLAIGGGALLVKGLGDWGFVAVFAGFVLFALGMTFAVLAVTVRR